MRSPNNIKLIVLLALAIVLPNTNVNKSASQTNVPPEPLVSNIQSGNMAWSEDSQLFVFQDIFDDQRSIEVDNQSWYSYDLKTGTLTQGNVWPLRLPLTQREIESYGISPDYFNYQSPDERYLVFGAPPELENRHLKVLDRQSGHVFDTQTNPGNVFGGTDRFNILWSANSSAFVAKTSPIAQPLSRYYFYVSGYSDNKPDATIQPMYKLTIGQQEYIPITVFELSHTGEQVLLTAATKGGGILMVWNPSNPTASIIHFISFGYDFAARFMPGDENTILIFNKGELVKYNLTDKTTTVLQTDIYSGEIEESLFSPNCEWIAFTTTTEIYLVNIADSVFPSTTTSN